MDDQPFSSFFNERVKDRGLTLAKLSDLSGISLGHLEALSRGDFPAMPPTPYFRGYVIRLGEILDFEPEAWWSKIKTTGFLKNSGGKDIPPANRFVKPWFIKFLWIAVIAVAVVIYASLQFARIVGTPNLQITYPDKNPAVSESNTITIRGTISNWNELGINGEAISVDKNGTWEKTVLLEMGLNTLEIRAKKFLGDEMKIIEQIIYQPTSTVNG